MNQTKIKGGCLSGRKVVTHDAKSDLPLDVFCRVLYVDLNLVWLMRKKCGMELVLSYHPPVKYIDMSRNQDKS